MIGTGGRRAGISTTWPALCATLAIVAALMLGPSASLAVTPADKAATHAYLQARYEYSKAILAGSKSADAAFSSFAAALEGECRGILAGAPGAEETSSSGPLSERQRGEAARERDQRSAIDLELVGSEFAGPEQEVATALPVFAAKVTALRWSDARIVAAVAGELAVDERRLPSFGAPEVCADMRAWAQSGYRKLTPRTTELRAKVHSELQSLPREPPVESLLRPYEGPVEHALARMTRQLESSDLLLTFAPLERVDKRLHTALGIVEPKIPREHRPVVLGRGKTRSGAKFSVAVESPQGGHRRGCRLEVSVEYTVTIVDGEGGTIVTGSDVNHVRLLLADGRTVTSPVVEASGRRGGPAGIYVQALGSRAAKPVSLTELDASGGVVRVQAIVDHRRCRIPRRSTRLLVSLVEGTTPAGTPFQIQGTYGAALGPGPRSLVLSLNSGQEFGSEVTVGSFPLRKTFPWSLGQECAPQEWAIVYGVMESPGASVTAVTTAGEVALAVSPIPASLHPGGVLAYGAFSQIPSRLIVRDADGQVIATEDLTSRVTEHREFCEGYVEP
jgi:hypothetical protein